MSMLTAHFSNLCMTPAIVKKLLGFKVNPTILNDTTTTTNSNSISSPPPSNSSSMSDMRSYSPFDSQDSNSSCSNLQQLSTNNNNMNQNLSNHNKMCEKAIRALVKKLKKTPGALEELEKSIANRDSNTKCIICPIKQNGTQDRVQVSRKTLPHVVYCRIWRWPDLQNCNELKSVQHCQQGYHANKKDDSNVCINPYHYIRIDPSGSNQLTTTSQQQSLTVYVPKIQQQSQQQTVVQQLQQNFSQSFSPPSNPPAFTNTPTDQLSNDLINYNMIQASPSPISILSPSSIGSNVMSNQFSPFISEDDSSEINDISPSPIGPFDLMPVPMIEQPYWCSLSYYEMKQRVGEMFHVSANVHSVTIDGYTDPSSAQRFCLGVLSNVNRTNEIEMTRHYIGRGLQLSYENGQVFAECLSENPVFVQSPNCNQRYHWHLATVVKIPPGCSLKIFDEADFVQVANETVYQGYEAVYALTRICTIRISFVKGWGAEYRRQTILNTPCWIEVHLNNPLKLVDQILTKMGSPRTKCTSVS
ncbi:unnamed protein product [Brachionus calyciflorus]|uniref:Mothers against decapentaplegic homolog n=1 Tax=Brachionus calyciflorus TaxID=104777 RepID=A0A813QW96_9BILA|nr:unnamed protein product [Brachionus calyciflorus]